MKGILSQQAAQTLIGEASEVATALKYLRPASQVFRRLLAIRSGSVLSDAAPVGNQCQLFWQHHMNGRQYDYSEQQSVRVRHPMDGQRQQISLPIQGDVGKVTRLRLDIADTQCVVDVHSMQLVAADQSVIWQWSGGAAVFSKNIQSVVLEDMQGAQGGCTVVTVGVDPWSELDLAADVYARIGRGSTLLLTVTPCALLDRLPNILNRLAHMATERRAAASTPASATSLNREFKPNFARELEDVATLIKKSLGNRDRMLVQQQRQLRQMGDELLRAEAQLDLLKDVMLNRLDADSF